MKYIIFKVDLFNQATKLDCISNLVWHKAHYVVIPNIYNITISK